MAHDGKKLYILVRCSEPFMDKIRVDQDRYSKGMQRDDRVDFNLSTQRGHEAFHNWFVFNTDGANWRANSLTHRLNPGFGAVPMGNLKGEDFWYAEIAYDFNQLLVKGEPIEFGREYYFNVGRCAYGVKQTLSGLCSLWNPDEFQICVFTNGTFSPEACRSAEDAFNKPYNDYLTGETARIAAMDWEREYGKYKTLDKENRAKASALSEKAGNAGTFEAKSDVLKEFQVFDAGLRIARNEVAIAVANASAIRKFTLNGEPVAVPSSGKLTLTITEGPNVLAAETAPGAKMNFTVRDCPQAAGRWRGAGKAPESWTSREFDDTEWEMVQAEADGSFTSPGCVRQILYWDLDHKGPYRLLYMADRWNFISGMIDMLQAYPDSPTGFTLKDYTITMDLPASMSMPAIDPAVAANGPFTGSRSFGEFAPADSLTEADSPRSGYKRWILHFPDGTATKPRKRTALLFIGNDGSMKPWTDFDAYYCRTAGNFVEITQTLPCRILPPVNGRFCKNFYWEFSTYGTFFPHKYVPEEAAYDHTMIPMKAGFNLFRKIHSAKARKEMAGLPIWKTMGTGFSRAAGKDKSEFSKFVWDTPKAHARFFKMDFEWGGDAPAGFPAYMNKRETTKFCPSYILGEGCEAFTKAVDADLKQAKERNPEIKLAYCNWEEFPNFGAMDWCFCDLCKAEFRKFADVPASIQLTDETIRDKYNMQWVAFRTMIDGKTTILVNEILRNRGIDYWLYSQTRQQEFWKAARGGIALPYLGCPAGPALGSNQQVMDSTYACMVENNSAKYMMGQIFLEGWSLSSRGVNASPNRPKLAKSQFVRLAASFHGGASLWGAPTLDGIGYYIGEATRLIAAHESLFRDGVRKDDLVESDGIAYPDALVLQKGAE
ncbi:MAG: hypothetical protein GX548_12840, partial [Lentisphaerae bacterium]|nr:hypothetical protein [Lentisphaerota bacterium]